MTATPRHRRPLWVGAIVLAVAGTFIVALLAAIPAGLLATHTDVPGTLRAAE